MILIGEHSPHPPCMHYLIRCLCFYVQFRELSLPLRDLPNITEADAVDPNTVDDDNDDIPHRRLYHALLHSKSNKKLCQNFLAVPPGITDVLCITWAEALTPEFPGFERSTGGRYVAVIEKVRTQDVARMESFKGLRKWKEVRLLVTDFPERG